MICKIDSLTINALLATVSVLLLGTPTYAGMCAGTSPGASPSTLPPSFVDTGSGFYQGMKENIFVNVFAGSDGITAMDVIYSNDSGSIKTKFLRIYADKLHSQKPGENKQL